VESLIEEEDIGDDGDDGNLNDHSHDPDPSDLLTTEMDPIDGKTRISLWLHLANEKLFQMTATILLMYMVKMAWILLNVDSLKRRLIW